MVPPGCLNNSFYWAAGVLKRKNPVRILAFGEFLRACCILEDWKLLPQSEMSHMPPKMGWSWAVVPSAKVMGFSSPMSPPLWEALNRVPLFIYRASGMVAGAMGLQPVCFQLCQSTAVDLGQAALCLSFPSVKWNNENNKFSLRDVKHRLINTWKASTHRQVVLVSLLFYLLQRLQTLSPEGCPQELEAACPAAGYDVTFLLPADSLVQK